MNTRLVSIDSADYRPTPAKASWLDRIARRMVLSKLEQLGAGQIVVTENGEHTTYGQLTDEFPLSAYPDRGGRYPCRDRTVAA